MGKLKIEIKWAFIYIAALLLWMVVERIAGLHDSRIHLHLYLTLGFLIPAIWIYVLALKDKRDRYFGGTMSYKQGLISGLFITLIITVLSPLTQWIISFVITPHFFTNVIEYSLEVGYHESREEAEQHFNYSNYARQSFTASLFLGLIITAVVAFFVKKPKNVANP